MYIAISEQEIDALRGLDHSLWVLYMHLKQYMDYSSGVVGYARRISYQSISEALYIEPRQGVKGGSPHISRIRRMLDQLIKHNVIKKSRNDTLVFKLHLADTDFYNQNKADMKPTGKADRAKASKNKAFSENADIPKTPKADIPHLSLNNINNITAAATDTEKSTENQKTYAAADHFIFHKSINQEAQQFMLNASKDFNAEQRQVLFDELAGFIAKGKIKSNLMGLFLTFIGQVKSGLFIPVYADHVKQLRENPPAEKVKLSPDQVEAKRAADREAARQKRQQLVGSNGKLIDFLKAKKGEKAA